MRPSLALPVLAALLLSSCDKRGEMPLQGGTGSVGGQTSGGSTGGGGTDTSKTGGGKDTSTVVAVFDSTSLWGPTTPLVGGTSRRVIFFLTDARTFHVVASSDGQPAGGTGPTLGRRTDWEIRLVSQDSIHARALSNSAESGFYDTIWNFVDSTTGTFPHVARIRLHTITGKPEIAVTTDSGARVTVSVLAWSGVDPKTWNWTIPRLPNDSVSRLVYGGKTPVPVGSWTFQIQMPVVPRVGAAD